ncbi:hypothetical protein VTK73DRAFT_5115 [Phialemonium thermophilum]|uniref:DNA polymerase eta n=1 Tax=Phialemonium thermophilum TaxID=223376 RepID=A0ABR3WPQ0_9PEZI
MSSPELFRDSSPAADPGRRRSQFTYRHLSQLASFSTSCPLRVVAHVDLDAFYAQCEMVRLGVAEDQPLAVQQWQGLIAVNYPARSFGIGRHCTVTEAKKLCPDLIAQHVATWREGDDKWAYHPDAAANIATHKVSLDPYRLESRKIFAVVKESLPPDLQKVEKAGIDELFLDLSAHVHSVILERYRHLLGPPPSGDANARLPMPPVSALDWMADALVDLDDEDAETDDPDWDDVAILIGSEIVRNVRAAVKAKLNYTCSAGISKNKMLSKLGSGYTKPNKQTVIRNRAIQHFLSGFKFTKIRNLGGKLGDQVAQMFGTDKLQELLAVPVQQLQLKMGDDTGVWIYNTIRGIDTSEVNQRTQIKSMLSAKSFRPSINSFEQAVKWLRIFVADIFSRLVEEGVLENRRRPKTINLYHRHGGQTRSRQAPIPLGRPLDEGVLLDCATSLLSQIVREGNVWPCANLSLSVGGFEDGVTGNMGIGAFLVKGEAAVSSKSSPRDSPALEEPCTKRRQLGGGRIERFLTAKDAEGSTDGELGTDPVDPKTPSDNRSGAEGAGVSDPKSHHCEGEAIGAAEEAYGPYPNADQMPATDYVCARCGARAPTMEESQSHQDWHLAKDLQEEEERGSPAFAGDQPSHAAPAQGMNTTSRAGASGPSSRRGVRRQTAPSAKRRGRPRKVDPGQKTLNFG